jgi:hypothetical protein
MLEAIETQRRDNATISAQIFKPNPTETTWFPCPVWRIGELLHRFDDYKQD